MLFNNNNITNFDDEVLVLSTATSWNPDDDAPVEGDWDDEDDEDFDDRIADLDDLHEIQVDEDMGEPAIDDDDHFPEEDDEEDDE
jgi:hypothetical protein